jgi:hypothetical protein
MPCDEPGTVEPRNRNLVEREPGRQRRDGPDSMASGTGTFRVTTRAEVPCARGSHPVLPQPIAVVNEVTHRRSVLRREVLVTAVAVAQRPLVAVLVAAEAGGHLRPDHLGALFGHGLVTADAVSVRRRLMRPVLET